MKIDYALMSCDDNPLYIDFMPLMTRAWNRIGIRPVYVIICDSESRIDGERETVIRFKKIKGISMASQALHARIWAWKMMTGNCILSDIDMLPISGDYFNGIAARYEEDNIVSYCDDAYEKFGQIASCYILGNSRVMGRLITEECWEDYLRARVAEVGDVWGGDQEYLGRILKEHPYTVRLRRGFNMAGQADNRLDRDYWKYTEDDIKQGRIYDSHLLRPYKDHKEAIDKLESLL